MTREVFWNIGSQAQLFFYSLSAVAIAIFLIGVYRIARIWLSSWGEQRDRSTAKSLWSSTLDILLGRRIFRGDVFGGLAHFFIMWGWVFLFIGTALLTIHHDIVGFLYGTVYLTYSLALDLAGAFFIAGVLMAAYRRFVLRANQVHSLWDDPAVLALLFTIAVTGFLVEGLRLWSISTVGMEWSPVGDLVAKALDGNRSGSQSAHRVVWWVHSLAALGLVAYLPYSKLFHMFSSPTNIYLGSTPGILTVEEREKLQGAFDRTELISMDACTRCNRCEVVCPSYAAGEPLSPRALVLALKSYARAGYALERRILGATGTPPGIEQFVAKGEAWFCTTCGACAERCPVGINPADLARDSRAAMIEGGRSVPRTVRDMLNNVNRHGNPWEARGAKRFVWQKELGAKDLSQSDTADLCYYVGDLASGDERNQQVAKAMVRVLDAAGVDYAIMGKEEFYHGEDVRRLGEDGLFESVVEGNYELLKDLGISNLVTTSPHSFHTMAREYPVLKQKLRVDGAPDLRVRHHTMLLAGLLDGGALKLSRPVERVVAYHDPCYLGRHNGVYAAPRRLLSAIPGLRSVELPRSRENSFCCGGGGGRMWLESDSEHRISELRAQEAVAAGVQVLATACPYCLSNLSDGITVAGHGDSIEVKDVVELLAEAIQVMSNE